MAELFQESLEKENKKWDDKMAEVDAMFNEMANKLVDKQKQELEAFHDALEKSIPTNPKPSSKLLNLRQIQQNLAKQNKYDSLHSLLR